MKVQKLLVTRNELREMGLSYSNTHYNRLEKMGLLTPVKPPFRSGRVRYRLSEVLSLIDSYAKKRTEPSD
jgi:hypothetical protein